MVNDTLGDMLTRIKNAYLARHETLVVPKSKLKEKVLGLLVTLGYIKGVAVGKPGTLVIELKYVSGLPIMTDVERISRPGLRRYANVFELKVMKRGRGFFVLSTPKGIKTHIGAQKEKVGGELLFKIW